MIQVAWRRRVDPTGTSGIVAAVPPLSAPDLAEISSTTLAHYERSARQYWDGTHDHDVSQNVDALLDAIAGDGPHRILDLGCGPGRDLVTFRERGHRPTGLDGSEAFVHMARAHADVDVWHQDFLALGLPAAAFDGVFANASLFHVPSQEVVRVLSEVFECLCPAGVLFSSNPRGDNTEGWNRGRYGAYHDFERWHDFALAAGFEEIRHYYRPDGMPRAQQPWLASLWRRPNAE